MTNTIENLRKEIEVVIRKAVEKAENAGEIPQIGIDQVIIETPREKEHGDFSTNIAMQAAKQAKMPPRKIAEAIIRNMDL